VYKAIFQCIPGVNILYFGQFFYCNLRYELLDTPAYFWNRYSTCLLHCST
jgi:hypothetical protein